MSTEPPNHIPDPLSISVINKKSANVNSNDMENASTSRASTSRLTTPLTSRPNSGTNLPGMSTKVHMKRPKLDERAESIDSVTRTPISQKPSNRFTIQTNARAANGTPKNIPNASNPIIHTGGTNPSGFTSTPALTSLDMGKKRLVDQFYTSYKDPHTSSGTDLTQHFKTGTSISPSAEKTFRFNNYVSGPGSASEDSLSSDIIGDLVQSGGFAYIPVQNHPNHDESLTNQLLNIDSLVSDSLSPNMQPPDGLPNRLAAIALSLTTSLVSRTRDSTAMTPVRSHNTIASTTLDKLSQYLGDVRTSTLDILTHLDSNKDHLKEKFRSEINDNVDKLDEIISIVNTLEFRLNHVRSKVSLNKQIMSQDLSPKLALLEKIDKRIAEYAKSSRRRHFRQLSTTVVLLLALGLLYTVYIR